jgi:hypothetical protein
MIDTIVIQDQELLSVETCRLIVWKMRIESLVTREKVPTRHLPDTTTICILNKTDRELLVEKTAMVIHTALTMVKS